MLIAYISKTGNIKRFVKKIPFQTLYINENDIIVNEKMIFITYTTGIGEVPLLADNFCKNNKYNIVGLASSGNKNWGTSYGIAADILSKKYNIPVLMKFELSGRNEEVNKFISKVNKLKYLEVNKTRG